jgi:hypothetical protein
MINEIINITHAIMKIKHKLSFNSYIRLVTIFETGAQFISSMYILENVTTIAAITARSIFSFYFLFSKYVWSKF